MRVMITLFIGIFLTHALTADAVNVHGHHHGRHHHRQPGAMQQAKHHNRRGLHPGDEVFLATEQRAAAKLKVQDDDCWIAAQTVSFVDGSCNPVSSAPTIPANTLVVITNANCDVECFERVCVKVEYAGQEGYVDWNVGQSSSCAGGSSQAEVPSSSSSDPEDDPALDGSGAEETTQDDDDDDGGITVKNDGGGPGSDAVVENRTPSDGTTSSALTIGQINPVVGTTDRLLVQGDGLCWKTGNIRVALKPSACDGDTITWVPKQTIVTPLYESQTATSCSKSNGPLWIKVDYKGQVGWLPHRKVIKHHCVPTTCTFTPIAPLTCYRVTLVSSKIGPSCTPQASGAGGVEVPKSAILTVAEGVEGGCDTTTMRAVQWRQVERITQPTVEQRTTVHRGWIEARRVEQFSCNFDGWLDSVGGLPVERLDRTNHKGGTNLQDAPLSKFVLHVTDGRWPRYNTYAKGTSTLDGSGNWPHFILGRDTEGVIRLGQYYAIYNFARATEDVGRIGTVQIEIGAKAVSPFTQHDAALSEAVRLLWHELHRLTGIPLCIDSRVNFVRDISYGRPSDSSPDRGLQRLDMDAWRDIKGLLGHQHVKDATHWCPGQIDPFMLAQDVPITAAAVGQPTGV